MTISINWGTKVIYVPKADLALIDAGPPEVREIDVDLFRLILRYEEATEDGMAFPETHRHITDVVVGGITIAPLVEIINGYTITFEDGSYIVSVAGGNSNLLDVTNLNSVSVRSANSTGLVSLNDVVDQVAGVRVDVETWGAIASG